jgi:S1-C subfamily serine protease
MRKQIALIVLISFFMGGIASPIFDRKIVPYLSTLPGMGWLRGFQADSPIIINRREQIEINDGINTIALTKQAQNFTVSIFGAKGADLKLLGSGIIMTADGLILTSKALLEDLNEFTVVLNDGRSFKGMLRALDRKSEVAVITIQAPGLTVAPFDEPYDLEVAKRVIVLGKTTSEYTRMFSQSQVTRSVKNNPDPSLIRSTETLHESFAISSALGADFAGGPVVNSEGKVVGMVANEQGKIITSEGLNQALSSYLSNQKIVRPYAGIFYLDYSKMYAGLKGLPGAGALVVSLAEDSPAKAAGLKPNDFIISIDDLGLDAVGFERLINRKQPGRMKVKFLREGEEQVINFEVQHRP